MTREQLDAIRARFDSGLSLEYDETEALLAEIKRLTSDMVSLESIIAGLERQLDGPRGVRARAERAEAEVERLTAERDTVGEVLAATSIKCDYAFQRGVAAMREAAVDACRPEYPDAVRRLRALPDPEDKP